MIYHSVASPLALGQRLLLTLHENVIERIVADRLRQALDPLLLVLLSRRRHAIHRVLSLHNFTFRVGFTGFYNVRATARVQLKAVRLIPILYLPYGDILQWNNATRFLVGRVLEIVQAVVVQDEPSAFP